MADQADLARELLGLAADDLTRRKRWSMSPR